jgi:hypothetical protein
LACSFTFLNTSGSIGSHFSLAQLAHNGPFSSIDETVLAAGALVAVHDGGVAVERAELLAGEVHKAIVRLECILCSDFALALVPCSIRVTLRTPSVLLWFQPTGLIRPVGGEATVSVHIHITRLQLSMLRLGTAALIHPVDLTGPALRRHAQRER